MIRARVFLAALFALSAIIGSVGTVNGQETSLIDRIEPFGSYGHVYDADTVEAMRPRVMGTNGVVATGHYLATLAGVEALRQGGNAFDAGVSSAMALKALKMGTRVGRAWRR